MSGKKSQPVPIPAKTIIEGLIDEDEMLDDQCPMCGRFYIMDVPESDNDCSMCASDSESDSDYDYMREHE